MLQTIATTFDTAAEKLAVWQSVVVMTDGTLDLGAPSSADRQTPDDNAGGLTVGALPEDTMRGGGGDDELLACAPKSFDRRGNARCGEAGNDTLPGSRGGPARGALGRGRSGRYALPKGVRGGRVTPGEDSWERLGGDMSNLSLVGGAEIEASFEDVEFTVTLSSALPSDAFVDVQTVSGTAFEDVDFDELAYQLTIPAGVTSVPILVPMFGDSVAEGDEGFEVELTNPIGVTFEMGLPTLRALGIIIDDDGENRPALFVSDPVVVEGNSGTREAVFEITLSRSLGDVIVPYTTVARDAAAGTDFVAKSGNVSFSPTDLTQTVTVDILGDTVVEPTERFDLVLDVSALDLANGAQDAVGTAAILDDDAGGGALPVLTLEGGRDPELSFDSIDFVARLSAPVATDVTFDVQTVSATAVEDLDFDEQRLDTFTIPAGDTALRINIPPFGDDLAEGDETFELMLSNVEGAVFEGGSNEVAAIGVIVDNDGENRPALSVGDARVVEGTSGSREAVFDVVLTRPFDATVSIPFQTVPVSAEPGADYATRSGVLTFLPGQTAAVIKVPVFGDTAVEATEQFDVVLDVSGVDLARGAEDAVGHGTILDDDAGGGFLPVLSVADASHLEQSFDSLDFILSLSAPAASDVTLDLQTASATADEDVDFDELGQQSITIPAGDTTRIVSVQPYSDDAREGDEFMRLLLSNVSGAVFEGGTRTLEATGTIIDDDGENRPALFVGDTVVVEGDSGTREANFDITLSRPLASTLTVPFQTVADSADGSDFVARSGNLVFAPGQTDATVTVLVNGDTENEPTEAFDLVLDTSGIDLANGVEGAVGRATILDDDAGTGALPVLTLGAARHPELSFDSLDFIASLSAPSASDITFDLQTISGTGIEDVDFDEVNTSITIPAGDTTRSISVAPFWDSVAEGDESLFLQILNLDGAVLEGDLLAVEALGIVEDNDGENRPAVFVENITVVEGDAGAQQVSVEVRLSRPVAETTTLGFTTAPRGGASEADIAGASGTLTFLPGQTVRSVTFDVLGDTAAEATEFVDVVVSGPVAPGLGLNGFVEGNSGTRGTVTILDDDTGNGSQPVLSVADAFHVEQSFDSLDFVVSLSAPSSNDITFRANTNSGTATEDVDFDDLEFATFTIPAGETSDIVSVAPFSDSLAEGTETFELVIDQVSGAVVEGGGNSVSATGTILDDDSGSAVLLPLLVEDVTVNEGESGSFQVRSLVPAGLPITGDWELRSGTATAGSDFAAASGSFTIGSNDLTDTIAFDTFEDMDIEGDEKFVLALSNIQNAGSGNRAGEVYALATIVDDDGAPAPSTAVWEMQEVRLNTTDRAIAFERAFTDPVVIAQAPSERGGDPVAVRIRDVTATSAVLRLQEPESEDGFHIAEDVSVLIVEAGTHRLADGTIVQAGTLESGKLSSAGFEDVTFHDAFAATPGVFSQVQTTNGADFVVTRQRDAGETGVAVTMQEEEARNGGGHIPETIGWVAVEQGTGTADGLRYEVGTTGDRVRETVAREDFASPFDAAPALVTSLATFDGVDPAMLRLPSIDAAGFDVRVQEDTSRDAEVFHTTEAVDWMAVSGPGAVTGTAAARIGEVLAVELTHVPVTLDFSATYDNPVVIAQGPSFRGGDAAAVRLREVTPDGVTLSLQEPDSLDGFHIREAVTVVVMEAGRHVLADGTAIEAGTLTSSKLSPQGFEQVTFATGFAERPAILSQIQTFNGPDFAVTRQAGADADGVRLTMQEEEAKNGGGHASETLGWLAIETGAGVWSGLDWEAGTTARAFGDAGARHAFSSDFDTAPNVVGAISSFVGADPAMLRFDGVDAAGFDAVVQEDRSADPEVRHAPETLDYIAFAGVGPLSGFEVDPV